MFTPEQARDLRERLAPIAFMGEGEVDAALETLASLELKTRYVVKIRLSGKGRWWEVERSWHELDIHMYWEENEALSKIPPERKRKRKIVVLHGGWGELLD